MNTNSESESISRTWQVVLALLPTTWGFCSSCLPFVPFRKHSLSLSLFFPTYGENCLSVWLLILFQSDTIILCNHLQVSWGMLMQPQLGLVSVISFQLLCLSCRFPLLNLCAVGILNEGWGVKLPSTHRGPPPVSYNPGSNVLGCRHATPGWPCFPQLRGIHFSVILFARVTCIFMKVCFRLTDTINRFPYDSLQTYRLIQQKARSRLRRKEEATLILSDPLARLRI